MKKKCLDTLGFNITEFDIAGRSSDEISTAIRKNNVVFITGGAPFYLLREIRKSGFNVAIKAANENTVFIGQSAGSYVACPTTEMGLWKKPYRNTFGLTDFTSIGLVNFLFFAHYEEKYSDILELKKQELDMDIYGVNNSQAIGVLNGKKTFVNF